MSTTLTKSEPAAGGGGVDLASEGFSDFGGRGGGASGFGSAYIGLWVTLGSLTMLFAAFTSAYIVRSTGSDWAPIQMPFLLWINTVALVGSSVTMELSRRAFKEWKPLAFRKWSLVTLGLGTLFLVGQLIAWQQLAGQGIFLDSNPHSSFFYVLTGVHAVHLVAGLLALLFVLFQCWRYRLSPDVSEAPGLAATYWHFVGAVWIYLLVVLFYL